MQQTKRKKAKSNIRYISFADIYFYDLTNIKMINTKKSQDAFGKK